MMGDHLSVACRVEVTIRCRVRQQRETHRTSQLRSSSGSFMHMYAWRKTNILSDCIYNKLFVLHFFLDRGNIGCPLFFYLRQKDHQYSIRLGRDGGFLWLHVEKRNQPTGEVPNGAIELALKIDFHFEASTYKPMPQVSGVKFFGENPVPANTAFR